MIRYIIYITVAVIGWSISLPARAQMELSDSLRISLLTCSAGPDAYERFGHTGIRVEDMRTGLDVVFHYGVFSFSSPFFVYRFVKGETDYRLGALYTADFIAEYRERGLGLKQQTLRLNKKQQAEMGLRLLINYRPENRTYRYSFFFDNCATRPYRLVDAATEGHIEYDSLWTSAYTLRQMIHEKTGTNNWLEFGIALAVASRADVPTSYVEQMFLPDYLAGAYDHAMIYGYPLVTEKVEILKPTPEVEQEIRSQNWWLSPGVVFGALFVLAIILNAFYRGRYDAMQRTFDTMWLFLTGLAGCIIWFLNFFSEHPAVDHNLNCLWLLPTNAVFALLIWTKVPQKVHRIYFLCNFAALILYFMLDWSIEQYCPPAFLFLLGTIMLRDYVLITKLGGLDFSLKR